ncbi:MAG: uracil-DNA glycosylase, partial [Gemmatimonadetes bacterium]|nr:uracil-DNA glycosylase [Gemmatimonadota bacterium]
YLDAELALLQSICLVVPLGKIAYESWLKASGWWDELAPRHRPPFVHGAEAVLPDGTIMLCSYHPSRQNTNTGRLTMAMWHDVFRRARRIIADA